MTNHLLYYQTLFLYLHDNFFSPISDRTPFVHSTSGCRQEISVALTEIVELHQQLYGSNDCGIHVLFELLFHWILLWGEQHHRHTSNLTVRRAVAALARGQVAGRLQPFVPVEPREIASFTRALLNTHSWTTTHWTTTTLDCVCRESLSCIYTTK